MSMRSLTSLVLATAVMVTTTMTAGTPAGAAAGLSFAPALHFAGGNGPWLLATGDVLGNGHQDIAVANIDGFGANAATLLMNTTATHGVVGFAAPIGFSGISAQAPLLADLNGDGRLDLVVC